MRSQVQDDYLAKVYNMSMHILGQHKHNHHHLLQYVVLFILLGTAFSSFVRLSGFPDKQFKIGLVMAATYILWGIFHHLYDRDFHVKVVVEYAGLAFLGLGMLWILLSYTY